MPRPRRMYKEASGKYYYIIDGKKKYIKVPPGVSTKRLAKINIQNIINLPSARRRKKGGVRQPKFAQKIASNLEKTEQGGLPLYLFKPQRKIATLEELAKNSDDTSVDKLTKLLLKGITATPSSSKIAPTIATMTQTTPTTTAEVGSQTKGKARTVRKLGVPLEPFTQKPTTAEAAVQVGKRQITPDQVTDIIGIIKKEKKGADVFYEDVRNFIKNNYDPEAYSNITKKTFEYANEIYNFENPSIGKTSASSMPPPPTRKPPLRITDTESTFETEAEDPMYRKGERRTAVMKEEIETDIEGFGYNGDGLYNDEIEKIVKKRIKDYVPVIASDQLNELPKYVSRGDKRFGFVINTNPSTSDGSGNDSYPPGHWTAVFINNEDDYPSIEYFDPLAQGKMPEDLIKMCRRIAVKMNPEVMFKYKQNMLRRQSKMTSNCGFHAVKYLDDRYNGVPYSEATGYDDYMESLNSTPDGSRDGEKEIASYIKKYESYI